MRCYFRTQFSHVQECEENLGTVENPHDVDLSAKTETNNVYSESLSYVFIAKGAKRNYRSNICSKTCINHTVLLQYRGGQCSDTFYPEYISMYW